MEFIIISGLSGAGERIRGEPLALVPLHGCIVPRPRRSCQSCVRKCRFYRL